MRIVDDDLLRSMSQTFCCAWCKHIGAPFVFHWGVDPHHIFSKGAGRVDIPENLVPLCRTCHNLSHAGLRPRKKDLLKLVAKREGTTPRRIENLVNLIRRTPKPIGYESMTPAELRAYAIAREERAA